jgi:hypothetical protein
MKYFILSLFLALSLTGCDPKTIKQTVPVYQEVVIYHPTETAPPVLRNPQIKTLTAKDIVTEASRSENSNTMYFILTQEGFQDWLYDDAEKLKYAQSEKARADNYKQQILDWNDRVREKNANPPKDK